MTDRAPSAMALSRGSLEGTLAAARRCREEIAATVGAAEYRLSLLDDGLRPEIRREREGIVRAEARAKVGEALARARQLRETVTALRGMNSRVAALRRARFSANDVEHAALGSYWLSVMSLMDPAEIAEVVRERASGPGGAAVAWLGHLAARGKVAAIEDEGERRAAAAAMQETLESVPCEVDELAGLLDAALAEVGKCEIAATALDERRDVGRILQIAREHGVDAPRRPTPYPAETAAAAGGADAAA